MMKLELVTQNPEEFEVTQVQAETYRLLLSLGEGCHSSQAIAQQLGLRSTLPLWSRIKHLEEKGLIRTSESAKLAIA